MNSTTNPDINQLWRIDYRYTIQTQTVTARALREKNGYSYRGRMPFFHTLALVPSRSGATVIVASPNARSGYHSVSCASLTALRRHTSPAAAAALTSPTRSPPPIA